MSTQINNTSATLIDMSQYVLAGEGANGRSYNKLGDPDSMVKLYNEDYPVGAIYYELEVAQKAFETGIKTPKPGILVTDGKRLGITFKRIKGKRSFSRMLADEPERVDEFATEFARCCKEFHAIECAPGTFPDVKKQFLQLLTYDRAFDKDVQQAMAEFIMSAPDANCAIHGDMHMGNLISTLQPGAPITTPHEVFFIDLGYLAQGCPMFDLGMLQNICLYADETFRVHDFHINGELTAKFWDSFLPAYFFAEDKLGEKWFGKGATTESVNEQLKKYSAVKLLLVEYNLGYMPDGYIDFVNPLFK